MKKIALAALVMFMALSAHSQATLSLFLNGDRPIVRNMPKDYRVRYFVRTADSSLYFIVICPIDDIPYKATRLFSGTADKLTERIIAEEHIFYNSTEYGTNDYILNLPNHPNQPSVRHRVPVKVTIHESSDDEDDEPDTQKTIQELLWVQL